MIVEFFAAYTQGSLQMYLFICHLYQIEALELQHSSPADRIIVGTEKKSLLHYRHQKKLHLVCLQNLAYIPPKLLFFFLNDVLQISRKFNLQWVLPEVLLNGNKLTNTLNRDDE